jgi:MFS transporter, DHA1 family, inner membrane transport protein
MQQKEATSNLSTAHSAEPVRARVLLPLCVAAFSGLLNVSVLSPFVAVIATDLSVTVPAIGFAATSALISTAVFGLGVGWLADRAGFRRVLIVGLFCLALSGGGVALATGYAAFLFARVVGAIGFAATGGLPNAIAATRYAGSDRQRALGWISAASVLAGLIGPPALTFVGDLFSWRAAFALVGGMALLAAAGVRVTVPASDASATTRPSLRDGLQTYLRLLQDARTGFVFLASLTQMAALIGTMVYVGAYLTDELGMSVRYVGFAFAFQSAGGFIGSIMAGRLPERNALRIYVMAILVLGIAIAGVYSAGFPTLVVVGLLAVAGGAQVTAWVTLIGTLSRVTPAGQGSTMVLNGSMLGIGGAAGTAAGGAAIGLVGYVALGGIFSLLTLVSAGCMWVALRR